MDMEEAGVTLGSHGLIPSSTLDQPVSSPSPIPHRAPHPSLGQWLPGISQSRYQWTDLVSLAFPPSSQGFSQVLQHFFPVGLVSSLFILSCSFVSSGQKCFGGFFMVSLVSWTLSRTILHRPQVEHSLCVGLSPALSLQTITQTGKLPEPALALPWQVLRLG